MKLTLPRWYDLHAHFRQGGIVAPLLRAHLDMGCAGILAMPNTKPPVGKVHERDDAPHWSIENYLSDLNKAGGDAFDDIIVPLYLTKETTPGMIAAGAKSGLLRACKYYPPHGTTGADFGCPLDTFMDNGVLEAMEANGVVLCIHGEEHALPGDRFFARGENAEEIFYRERMPRLAEKFPDLKIVCEHVTTKVAADFVAKSGPHIGATVTPQHLLYTVGDLLQGLKYHLYCMPLLKFAEDRAAVRAAVVSAANTKFFAGTDSAPHATKCTPCGCAAGCYTGGIAPQLYAQGFESAGADLSSAAGQGAFRRFLCDNGPAFYGLKPSSKNFTLEKAESSVDLLQTPDGPVTPLPVGLNTDHEKSGTRIGWRVLL